MIPNFRKTTNRRIAGLTPDFPTYHAIKSLKRRRGNGYAERRRKSQHQAPDWSAGAFSIYSTYTIFYLLDNLRPSENQNIFSFLVLARNISYFLIAVTGIWWFYENRKRITQLTNRTLKNPLKPTA